MSAYDPHLTVAEYIVSRSTPEEARIVLRVLHRLSDDEGQQAMHGALLEIGGIGYDPSESAQDLREVLMHAAQLAVAMDDALDVMSRDVVA